MRVPAGTVAVGTPRRWSERLAETAVVLFAAAVLLLIGWYQIRPLLLSLGSTAGESSAPMPGDELVADPRTVMTRSTTLAGKPEDVWPWLVQMGVGKGGFYGYAWLENLGPVGILDDIRNADRIHPEWQELAVGDHVVPLPGSTSWSVVQLVPDRLLVIADDNAWTWTLQLRPVNAEHTRLVTRMRWAESETPTGAVGGLFFDLGDSVTVARTMHGLEQRVAGTLPGMPGTATGDPVPRALLPLGLPAAAAWLALLGSLTCAAGRLMVSRRGGWLLLMTVGTVLGWCLWTDTDPWAALTAHGWWAVATTALVVAGLAWSRAALRATLLVSLLPALCVAGTAVVLPAVTVWDAATAHGMTVGSTGRAVTVALAAAASALVSTCFWRAVGNEVTLVALAGAALAGGLVVTTGSVLAGAMPAAVLLAALVVPMTSGARPYDGRRAAAWSDHAGRGGSAAAAPRGASSRAGPAPGSW